MPNFLAVHVRISLGSSHCICMRVNNPLRLFGISNDNITEDAFFKIARVPVHFSENPRALSSDILEKQEGGITFY